MRAFFYLDCKLEFFVCYDLFAKARSIEIITLDLLCSFELMTAYIREHKEGDLEHFL